MIFGEILLTVVGVLLSVIILGIYLYLKHYYSYWERLGVENVPGHLLFGNIIDTVMGRESIVIDTKRLYDKINGPYGGTFLLTQPTLFIKDPELIKNILVRDFSYFSDRVGYLDEKVDPMFGNLFLMQVDKWRKMRQKLSPTFTSGKLKQMISRFKCIGQKLQNHVERIANSENNIIEAKQLLSRYTIDAIVSLAFGIEIDCVNNPAENFYDIGRFLSDPPFLVVIKQVLILLAPQILKFKFGSRKVENFLRLVTEESLYLRENKQIVRKDFMQLLIQLRNTGQLNTDGDWYTEITDDKKLTVEEIMAQIFIFFLGGFDTSSTAAAFTLFELAKNKHIQKKAQNEIDTIMTKYKNEWTYDCIQDMKYIDQCLDESLRLYPPAPFILRNCVQDYTIEDSNITIKKGISIHVNTMALHRDPKYFPNPLAYDPERFTPEAKANLIPCTYLPFGDGPRNCIGMRYGQLQSKIGIIAILSKFNLELSDNRSPNIKFEAKSFLTVIGGLELNVSLRK